MSAKKVIVANDEAGSRKSVRYIAISTLAHLGLLTLIAATPRLQIGSAGQSNANAAGSTVMMDISNPEAADSGKLGNGGEVALPAAETALEAQATPTDTSALNTVAVQTEASPIAPPPAEVSPEATPAPTPKVVAAALPAKATSPVAPKKSPKIAKYSHAKIATKLPTKAGAAASTEQEESLPEAVTWKATERAHEAALAHLAQEQAADDASESAPEITSKIAPKITAEDTAPAIAPVAQAESASAPEAIADTAASDQTSAAQTAIPVQSSASAESPAPRRQGLSAIPITTQQFASAQNKGAGGNGNAGASQLGAPSGAQFRNAEELAEKPGNRMPAYPMQDRVNGHQGVVVLVGQVTQEGRVAKAAVQKTSGSIAMDQASMAAFRNWKFAPGQEGYVYKSFRFNLAGEAQEVPARLAQ